MSGANHITGGVVFTGIFASFWNINVFASPSLLFFTAFIAILPDIDHLKSPIGKLFYPIAKFLDRRYGHRTITHSLVCWLGLFCVVTFIERMFSSGYSFTLVFSFSYFSHLLFDMMTKQGVPLLYPFRRNPCVIPGNPDLRLKSSDLKTESVCFAIFLMLAFTCQPLFANGFWASYNRGFGTLKHIYSEYRQSENLVFLKFDISRQGKNIIDSGYVVKSSESESIVFCKDKFLTLSNDDKIINLLPTRTNIKFSTEDIFFNAISPDSLNKIILKRPILTLKIQSNSKLNFTKENKPQTSNSADLEYVFNPVFLSISDSLANTTKNRIELLNYELRKIKVEQSKSIKEQKDLDEKINNISNSIATLGNYEREKATILLSDLKQKKLDFRILDSDNSGKIQLQIRHLEEELKTLKTASINGYIQFINFN